jgi:hypothetical protein
MVKKKLASVLKDVQERANQAFCHFCYTTSILSQLGHELRDFRGPKKISKKVSYEEVKVEVKKRPDFGVCSHMLDILSYKDETLALLNELGVKLFRTDIPYSMVQDGKFDEISRAVDDLHDDGVEILGILGTWTVGRKGPPKNERNFLDYIDRVVCEYAEKIRSYEIWNEPNAILFWTGSVSQYANLLKVTAKEIKNIDDKIKVGINTAWQKGVKKPWSLGFIEKLSARNALCDVDFIGLHSYPGSWEPGQAHTWSSRINSTDEFLRSIDEEKELWVTEFGYHAFPGTLGKIFYPHSPSVQKHYLEHAYHSMASTGKVSQAFWYCLHDPFTLPIFPPLRFYPPEYGFGLYTKDFEPKDPDIAKVVRTLTNSDKSTTKNQSAD